MDLSELATISAADLGRLYRDGVLTPTAATAWFLDRIESTDDKSIFLCVTAERARREAAASTERYRSGHPIGLLDGVPVAWKDLFDLEGTTTTAGSGIYRAAEPARTDSAAVQSLAARGMVSLGKVNLSEFAYSGLGLNPHYGTPRNPHDTRVHRVPGGSSSGSAVAVAAGLAPCSIGTDTGGSVRIPAALNGLVGFKTREGAIDKQGVFALSPTLDTVGPVARTVVDCILLDAALRGKGVGPTLSLSWHDATIIVPTNYVFDQAETAVVDNFWKALEGPRLLGARVIEKPFPLFDEFLRLTAEHGSITAAEAYFRFRPLVESAERGRIDARVVDRIDRGATMRAFDWLTLIDARTRMQAQIRDELAGALLAFPTVPHVAPPVAPLEADRALFHAVNLRTLRNTMIGNFLNLPGLAIPSGADDGGMPTSILISALPGDEPLLFASGLAMEKLIREARAQHHCKPGDSAAQSCPKNAATAGHLH